MAAEAKTAEVKIVIPARLQSSRLAEKVLLPIAGRPMLEWVWRAAEQSRVGEVIIATDHERVAGVAQAFGARVCMTAAHHQSGSDRCAQGAADLGWADNVRVLNLQGDEPQMAPACLRQLAALSGAHSAAVCTLYQPIHNAAEWHDPAVVKVVCDSRDRALYFSRAAVPHCREGASPWQPDHQPQQDSQPQREQGLKPGIYRRHIGLYAYPVKVLRRFTALPPGALEQVEKLEQLRMLEAGIPVVLAAACAPVPAGVDTHEDWQRVCAAWSSTAQTRVKPSAET